MTIGVAQIGLFANKAIVSDAYACAIIILSLLYFGSQ
jgi:hypothetical protein